MSNENLSSNFKFQNGLIGHLIFDWQVPRKPRPWPGSFTLEIWILFDPALAGLDFDI
jgi:hypothetical protein